MLFATIGQEKVFLVMALCGVLGGAWYWTLARLRTVLRAGPALSLCADLLFGAGAFAFVASGLLFSCHGEVRLFSLLAVLFGLFLFETVARVCSRLVFRPIVRKIRQGMHKIAQSRLFKVVFR